MIPKKGTTSLSPKQSETPYYSQNYPLQEWSSKEPSALNPQRDRSIRRWLYGSVGIGTITLFSTLALTWLRPSILHYEGNDISHSNNNQLEKQLSHCLASLSHYVAGDRRKEIVFADIPEIIDEQIIKTPLLFNPCHTSDQPVTSIGHKEGTSLPRLLSLIATDITREKHQNSDQKVVVTITLAHAEVVGNQPALDEAGFEQIRTDIATIIGNNQGAIAIIGPSGELQNQLSQEFHTLSQVKICGFKATTTCVDWAFSQVR